MDRNREVRRATMAAANGLSRRRQRSGSMRDSPEEDGPVELPESGRLRDRGMKKDRDRDRDRDRSSRSSKRRRAERLMQGSGREEGMDDSSEESVNGEDDDEDEDGSAGAGSVRMLSPNPAQSISPSISNHNQNHHRKIFPPSSTNKVFRAPPAWKAADEMIGVSVPRKARSASTKRSHDCWTTGGGGVVEEQIHRQASTSPVRQNLASTSTPSPAPVSPSSSNASMRKKMKSNGAKLRPPKSSSKPSSNPEELEIEIAEVLYGLMTQSQGPPSDLGKFEANKASGDAKSRVSSPISNSPSSAHHSASVLPHNSSSMAPVTAVAPKRKRPRQVDDLGRRSPINSKAETDQASKKETFSPSLEKNPGSTTAENGGVSQDMGIYQVGLQTSESQLTEPARPDGSSSLLDLMKTLKQGTERNLEDEASAAATSPKKESSSTRPENHREDIPPSKVDMGSHQEKKFQIDLMAPPPQMKSSAPERVVEGHLEFISEKKNDQRLVSLKDKEDDKAIKSGKAELAEGEEEEAGPTGKKVKAEEGESERGVVANRGRNVVDLQFSLENPERETSASTKQQQQQLQPSSAPPKQPASNQNQKPVRDEPTFSEKTAQSNSLPIPISMAGWPGGIPQMGYITPLQGVVSMDGTPVATAPMQHLFSQPRPKRCATHCYVARNINYFQQLAKMNPFWPAAAAGTASIFGAKPCNLGVQPPPEMIRRNVVQQQDKSQGLTIFPVGVPDNKASAINDSTQRSSSSSSKQQQVILQQAMPQPPPPSNVMPGPTFIFPISQQHSAAASVRPGSVKSSSSMHSSTGASTVSSVSGSTPPPPGPANGLSFNYPNMPVGSETQYLAILQNGYPFPIPTVGGGPAYRGTPHPQSMAYFNGPFYSSQMIHPSQFQQQQQQPVVVQQQSSCSSASQKHLQAQQQPRPPVNNNSTNVVAGTGNFISFPQSAKDRSQSQSSVQQQQRQDVGADDGLMNSENRVARSYGQNLAVPVHQNFALMNPPSVHGGGSQTDKKQPILKGTVESLPQNFAISFASMNGANGATGLDISSSAQNHAVLQNLPEATRHGYQMMAAAAQGAQQQHVKNFRIHEEGKGDSSNNLDEEKKGLMVKGVVSGGQTIAFSRPELADSSRSSVVSGSTVSNSSPQLQPAHVHFQQQQLLQLQKQQQQQHQLAAAAARSKSMGGGSNSSAYTSDRSSNKFTNNTISPYPQNLVQSATAGGAGNGSPVQSPQWKNSRAGSPQVPSSLGSSNSSTMKNMPQQQQPGRTSHQSQTQISFSANSKSPMSVQQQQVVAAAAAAQCPPLMVGSPTTSSLSKGASGSPRTTNSNSTSSKTVQPSTLSSNQSKNTAASPSQKSTSVSGSILGNPHHISSSSPSTNNNSKTTQQNLQAKQQMLQPHLFFNPAYMQAAAPGAPPPATSSSSPGYYIQKRRPDQPNQQSQNSSSPSTSGMLSLCPVGSDPKGPTSTITNTNTTNTKGGTTTVAAVAATGIQHSGQFTTQSVSGNPHPLIPPGFYGHTIPSAIQVKPPEQKQQQAGGK